MAAAATALLLAMIARDDIGMPPAMVREDVLISASTMVAVVAGISWRKPKQSLSGWFGAGAYCQEQAEAPQRGSPTLRQQAVGHFRAAYTADGSADPGTGGPIWSAA
jgi:hypothetical protein